MTAFSRRGVSFLAAAACVLTARAEASALPPVKSLVKQSAATAHRKVVLSQLHAAHKLLIQADHDYDGHRARAAGDVSRAIHELSGRHHKPGTAAKKPGNAVAANTGKKHKMPQAQSDAHLREASQILTTVSAQLPAGHRASRHVHDAIAQINTAL